jgi:putative transposase
MSSGIISNEYGYLNRRSIRLKGYDYTKKGANFITICTNEHECLFSSIENKRIVLNEIGKIAETCWLEIPKHFHGIELDEFIIMPNHIHGIIVANRTSVGAKDFSPQYTRQSSPHTCHSPIQPSGDQRPHGVI